MTPDLASSIHSEVLRYVESCRAALGLRPDEMRVLDYGCGSGDGVLVLRRLGYAAFGADINASRVEEARAMLRSEGWAQPDVFSVVPADGRTAFADGQFHFIYSQQVFEHVADLNLVAHELRRLTAPGGYGFHVFPPRRRPQESHYYMPFVHWLPKNELRHAAMLGYALLGLGGRPPEIPGAGPAERASFLYRYSVAHTFYRKHREIAQTLNDGGLDVCFAVTNHRRLRASRALSRIVDAPALRPAIEWGLLTFIGVNLLTRLPDGAASAPTIQLDSWRGRWSRSRALLPAPQPTPIA